MVQYVFYVEGVRDGNDEELIVRLARAAFDVEDISISALTSALTICLPDQVVVDEMSARLASDLEEHGYILKLPPKCTKISNEIPTSYANEPLAAPHRSRRVSLSVFVSSMCALLILAVLGTYAVTSEIFDRRLIDIQKAIWGDTQGDDSGSYYFDDSDYSELELLRFLFDRFAIEDIDDEAVMTALLKAYAANTGDIYAEYYTAEEYEALNADNQGEMDGIGVSVVNDKVEINGFTYNVLTVISVFDQSPALDAGLRVGDCIYTVADDDGEMRTVDILGYDAAISCVRGVAGTQAKFTVLRFDTDDEYEIIEFSIARAPITSESVRGRVLESDPTIGIVKISQFDLTTPTQFQTVMDSLIEVGCTKFIFDVRYNPGGALTSIEAVLSTLLEEGDLMISTVYKDGSEKFNYVRVVDYSDVDGYEGCSVTKEDIGKYRGYQYVVLTNEYTASAAELFTSNLRDYELATLVGVTTYGKGCMQTTYDLSYFGAKGAVKMTTAWYEPPSGESYHDIGIAPDIEIEMDEALLEQYGNIYLILDEEDTQMKAAIQALNR